jgi:hypothetical protein
MPSEVELRRMLEDAHGIHPAGEDRRWRIHTRHAGRPWWVVLEVEPETRLLVIITVYAVD